MSDTFFEELARQTTLLHDQQQKWRKVAGYEYQMSFEEVVEMEQFNGDWKEPDEVA